MILLPDPNTAVVDPFRQHKTLNINCFVHDPVTLEPYSRDPRHIARKAEAYLLSRPASPTRPTSGPRPSSSSSTTSSTGRA